MRLLIILLLFSTPLHAGGYCAIAAHHDSEIGPDDYVFDGPGFVCAQDITEKLSIEFGVRQQRNTKYGDFEDVRGEVSFKYKVLEW